MKISSASAPRPSVVVSFDPGGTPLHQLGPLHAHRWTTTTLPVLIQAAVSACPSGRCLSRTMTCHPPGCCLRSVGCFPGQKVPDPCSQGRGPDPITHDVQIVALVGAPSRSRLRPLLFRLRVRPTQLSPAARVCSSWPPLPLLRTCATCCCVLPWPQRVLFCSRTPVCVAAAISCYACCCCMLVCAGCC